MVLIPRREEMDSGVIGPGVFGVCPNDKLRHLLSPSRDPIEKNDGECHIAIPEAIKP